MSACESVKKMLRSVLQSKQGGVPLRHLPSEYRSLCGEDIPLRKLGFGRLEDYLRSIPSVVRIEHSRMGELMCVAAVCKETAHLAELVAKQKSSQKHGRTQLVNCRMRAKPSSTYVINAAKPRLSLRQPVLQGSSAWLPNRPRPYSATGDFRGNRTTPTVPPRQHNLRFCSFTPIQHRGSAAQVFNKQPVQPFSISSTRGVTLNIHQKPSGKPSEPSSKLKPPPLWPTVSPPNCLKDAVEAGIYQPELVQSRLSRLLEKHCSGLWLSKLPQIYVEMFGQQLHPRVATELASWPHVCTVEKSGGTNHGDRLVYPPLSPKSLAASLATVSRPRASITYRTPVPATMLQNPPPTSETPKSSPLAKAKFLFPPRTLENPPKCEPSCLVSPDATPACTLRTKSNVATPECAAPAVSAKVRGQLMELLSTYSHGLWVHALPKLFMETFKVRFPEHLLDNLTALQDICSVEYPQLHDKKKAILYSTGPSESGSAESQRSSSCSSPPSPAGLHFLAPLVLPTEQYRSVLVTDTKDSYTVTVRYVGESYSSAQERMENAMQSFYSQSSASVPLSNPTIGQLAAVRGEDGDEMARVRVVEVMTADMVKVYYVDYGFSVEISRTNLLELHSEFLSLPFQAINVKLAGLESHSSHPALLSALDGLAVGKILLMEMVEPRQHSQMPLVVLYDTSQGDDLNINAACLKALWDKTLGCLLNVNITYQDVSVSSMSPDGTLCCHLPSRGTSKLKELLDRIETFFLSQVTLKSLVSRPFTGKFCLARHKGKWARAEITNLHGSRVMDIVFTDLGVSASVEVTELREIPAPFLHELTVIPPQVIKCCLADVKVEQWNPAAIPWLQSTLLNTTHCSMKVVNLDQVRGERLVHVYLFGNSDSQELHQTINHQLLQSFLKQNTTIASLNNNQGAVDLSVIKKQSPNARAPSLAPPFLLRPPSPDENTEGGMKPVLMPPLLDLPQPGQSMDVFVPVACHPGHFVVQPWQELYKLVVLMGEMVLYYNQSHNSSTLTAIVKGRVYAAKVDKSWHRVLVKGILTNGLVSVYELDYGKYELVNGTELQPLIEEFRQLPFQAVTAQLAGVEQRQWSEEASMVFRNHVENRALVSQVERVQEVKEAGGEVRERRLAVFLVDTSEEARDVWIHSIMADVADKLYDAA